jgi:uncharacterized protein YraI
MSAFATVNRRTVSRTRAVLVGGMAALILAPALVAAQTAADPTVFASTALNMRKGPGSSDAILTVVPLGGEVLRGSGAATNGYAPVTYNGISGWVVDLGLVGSVDEVTAATGPDPAPAPTTENSSPALYSTDVRYALRPLMLRTGPDAAAEALTGMPEGAVVTLTREGAENGYVTVDFDGLQGWAYADLLGEDEAMVGL